MHMELLFRSEFLIDTKKNNEQNDDEENGKKITVLFWTSRI